MSSSCSAFAALVLISCSGTVEWTPPKLLLRVVSHFSKTVVTVLCGVYYTLDIGDGYLRCQTFQDNHNFTYIMTAAPLSLKPKGYNSNYNYFQRKTLKDVAIEFPNLKDKDRKRVVSRRWHELSESERLKLKELADCDKARYCREVQIYNESFPEDRIVPRINPPDGSEVLSQDRFHSAYNHYMHQEKEFLLRLIPSSERKSKLGKYASVRWRHMDDEERQLYQDLEKFA